MEALMGPFSVKWIYELDVDYTISLKKYFNESFDQPLSFQDGSGRERLVLYPTGDAVIRAKYAWDGCTPKFALFDIVLGTPDGIPNEQTRKPKAYYASLVHDVLYQFLDAHLPIKRAGADRAFFDILERDAFAPRYLYWAAVRVFGGVFRLFTRWKRSYAGHRVKLAPFSTAPTKSAA
jgi:hypothetical protein